MKSPRHWSGQKLLSVDIKSRVSRIVFDEMVYFFFFNSVHQIIYTMIFFFFFIAIPWLSVPWFRVMLILIFFSRYIVIVYWYFLRYFKKLYLYTTSTFVNFWFSKFNPPAIFKPIPIVNTLLHTISICSY